MTNNYQAMRDKLLERFRYDQETGYFWHKKTARPYHQAGQRAEKRTPSGLVLRHDELHLPAKRVAWLFVTGEWPSGHLTTRNGDPDDNRFENLVGVREVSEARRRRVCKNCGGEYIAQRVDATAKYCSRECYAKAAERPLPTEATCKRCGTLFPISEFPISTGHVRRICRPCLREHARHRRLATEYGLSLADFEELLAKHNYVCAICRDAPETGPKIDHDHKTGVVRGILCGSCNTGLGHFRDDPKRLRSAAEYLEQRRQT